MKEPKQDEDFGFDYNKEQSCGTLILRAIFSHFGLLLLVGLYVFVGAVVFVELEENAELERYKDKQETAIGLDGTLNYTIDHIWFLGTDDVVENETQYKLSVEESLDDIAHSTIDACEYHKYDGTIDGWEYDWTIAKSCLLTMTIISTIGYGNIAPKTFEGQMFCIIYSLVGCALFLLFLANLGSTMSRGFILIYSRMCCRWFRARRYLSEIPEGASLRCSKLPMDDDIGNEPYMPTNELFVPITVIIVILHAYILFGAILFMQTEGWGITASLYFTFVTLSTIGYGDYVPGNALLDGNTLGSQLKMMMTVVYIILGMALLSMCINLIQEQIVRKSEWVAQEMGIDENTVEEARRDSIPPGSHEPIMRGSSPYRRPSRAMSIPRSDGNHLIPGTFG